VAANFVQTHGRAIHDREEQGYFGQGSALQELHLSGTQGCREGRQFGIDQLEQAS